MQKGLFQKNDDLLNPRVSRGYSKYPMEQISSGEKEKINSGSSTQKSMIILAWNARGLVRKPRVTKGKELNL